MQLRPSPRKHSTALTHGDVLRAACRAMQSFNIPQRASTLGTLRESGSTAHTRKVRGTACQGTKPDRAHRK
jgi:hypothetical protein